MTEQRTSLPGLMEGESLSPARLPPSLSSLLVFSLQNLLIFSDWQ